MKKIIYIILLGLLTVACSGPRLYQQGLKKIEKAISKDPSIRIPSDTTVVIKTDVKIDTVDNVITKTITNTITETRDTCNFDNALVKTNRQLRIERRMAKDSLSHERKMRKLDNQRFDDSLSFLLKMNKELTKQIEDTNSKEEKVAKEETKQSKGNWLTRLLGKFWWIVLLIGAIGGFILRGYIPTLPNIFRRNVG